MFFGCNSFFSFGTENLEEVKFYRFNAFDYPHRWFTLDAQDKKLMTPFREALELMRASKVPMGMGVDISSRPVAALIKATFLEIARPHSCCTAAEDSRAFSSPQLLIERQLALSSL